MEEQKLVGMDGATAWHLIDRHAEDWDDVGGNKCTRESAPDVAPQELRKEKQMGGPVNCNDSELSIYLQALAEGFLPTFYSDTSQCAQSRLMSIASKSYRRGKQTVLFHGFPSLQMSQNLMDAHGEALLTSYLAASRARTSAPQVGAKASKASAAACGSTWPASSVKYCRDSSSWKTAHCLWEEDLPWSSVTLPTWGMTRNGFVYQHPTAARPISATGAGLWPTPNRMPATNSLSFCCSGDGRQKPNKLGWAVANAMWPTPTASLGTKGGRVTPRKSREGGTLIEAVSARKTWPTPTVNDSKNSTLPPSQVKHDNIPGALLRDGEKAGGSLNPTWVEWLMGWPLGWTDLKPLAMDKFREWQQQHSPSSQKIKEAA